MRNSRRLHSFWTDAEKLCTRKDVHAKRNGYGLSSAFQPPRIPVPLPLPSTLKLFMSAYLKGLLFFFKQTFSGNNT